MHQSTDSPHNDAARSPARDFSRQATRLGKRPLTQSRAATTVFYLLDPAALTVPPAEAASSKIAATVAPKVCIDEVLPVDMVVVGSVTVDRSGTRIGKGAGYSDLEFAFLTEAGLISPETVVVTTVHALQVLDEPIPSTTHDFGVDLIVTPDEVITCPAPHRPAGLIWNDLPPGKVAAIPALAALAADL